VFQGQKSFVRQAESPIALIVRSTVRDPLRTIRKREQMRLQLAERHYCMHWHAVVHHVQIVMLKIYHPLPTWNPYVSVPNVPFLRNLPVEDTGSSRDFESLDWDVLLDHVQRLPNPAPGDATANRKHLGGKGVQFAADRVQPTLVKFFQQVHSPP